MDNKFFDVVDSEGHHVDNVSASDEGKAENSTSVSGDHVDDTGAAQVSSDSGQVGDASPRVQTSGGKKRRPKRSEDEEQPTSLLGEIIDWVKVIAVAAVLAFCLNNFIIANSTIPTGSMQDTIMAGARSPGPGRAFSAPGSSIPSGRWNVETLPSSSMGTSAGAVGRATVRPTRGYARTADARIRRTLSCTL